MKIRFTGVLLMAVLLFLSSCQSGILFEKTIAIPQEGWSQDNFLVYSIPVDDTLSKYNFSLIIRNEARYEYSNLFLFINITAPGGEGIRDTVEVRLSDERGNWLGSGVGGKHTIQVPFKNQVKFPHKGNYIIEIEQGMREKDLNFITDVGLRIKKIK